MSDEQKSGFSALRALWSGEKSLEELRKSGGLPGLTKPVPVFNPPTEPIPEWGPWPDEHPDAIRADEIYETLDPDKRELTRRERYLFEIVILAQADLHGGIDAYMDSWGDHSLACLEALAAVGATKYHEYLQNACNLFPGGVPATDYMERWNQIREICGEEDELDALVKGEGECNLYTLLMKYWDANE